jgi:capsular exopolysaccharide synthesis family protein
VDLNTFLSIIWRRKLVVGVTTLMTLFAVGFVTFLQSPVYAATTTLRVSTQTGRSGDSVRPDDLTYTERLMNTYGKLATSDPLLDQLARRLRLKERPVVTVELPANTEFMRLRVENSDRHKAAKAANLAAVLLMNEVRRQNENAARTGQANLSREIDDLEQELTGERERYRRLLAADPGSTRTRVARESVSLKEESLAFLVRQFQETRIADALRSNPISVAERATAPSSPASPRTKLNLALGLMLGFLAGIGLAFLAERIDPRIKTSEEVRELTDAPVVAKVPTSWPRPSTERGTRLFERDSPQREAMRRLPAHLARRPIKTLLVTSAAAGEGKTTIAANAAAVLSRSGNNVVAVDGDLRAPALHTAFGLPNGLGLSDVLRTGAPLKDAIQAVEPGRLSVITSGALPGDAQDLLGTQRMAKVLAELEDAFDVVVVDSPPFLPVSDGAMLAGEIRNVLVVIGRGQSRRDAVIRMFNDLARIEANVVGVVINHAEPESAHSTYYKAPRLRAVDDADHGGAGERANLRGAS